MTKNQWSRSTHCSDNTCVEVQWKKSQLSSTNGSCVEVGFQRSSYCDDNTCVEVKTCTCDEVLVRDSKDKDGPVLTFTRDEWLAFLDGAKKNEFDL